MAKKRHHESKKLARYREHSGMERKLHGYHMGGAEHYAGMEPRRRQELEDAGMIREDHSQVANLPQNVIMRAYPQTGPYSPEKIDDTIRGVDRQMDYDDSKQRSGMKPRKV